MKLRHAAALALVGWYLMVPPASPNYPESMTIDTAAPLSQWLVVPSFRTSRGYDMTAEQCEKTRVAMKGVVDMFRKKQIPKWSPGDEMTAQQYYNARCVNLRDDDPRVQHMGEPSSPYPATPNGPAKPFVGN
jgi:hypothetical protein